MEFRRLTKFYQRVYVDYLVEVASEHGFVQVAISAKNARSASAAELW